MRLWLCWPVTREHTSTTACCQLTSPPLGAVDHLGRDKDHNKEIYYERTIQTLEQQLLAFQQGLNGIPPEFEDDIHSVSEQSNSGMDDNNDELAVAEYMRKCRCFPSMPYVF